MKISMTPATNDDVITQSFIEKILAGIYFFPSFGYLIGKINQVNDFLIVFT